MSLGWETFVRKFGSIFPAGSPRGKLLQIVAIILIFEGISVLILFSYDGAPVGIFSMALGTLLLLLLHPGSRSAPAPSAQPVPKGPLEDPPGIKLIDAVTKRIGNDYAIMAVGIAAIILVLVYNYMVSARPELGDLDTLSIMFGGMIALYPFISKKFKVEAAFSLLFLGLVILFLVVPQAVTSYREDAGSSIGNWYVHYMLAAPFATILDLIGIPASSSGSVVMIQFQDGSRQALGISAYCAGLYSFSIFLAAFFSFVLVFERLRTKVLVFVLVLGLVVAYLGNLFRMVVIGIVGYYDGLDALLWAHRNAGWIIFLSWSAVFWYLLLRFTSKHAVTSSRSSEVHQ
jgi:archaeosortase C (PEF-CTERM variant)